MNKVVALRFTLGQSEQGDRFLFLIIVKELGKHLIWLCTESACNWIFVFTKTSAPFPQPIRSLIETNSNFPAYFPAPGWRLLHATCVKF